MVALFEEERAEEEARSVPGLLRRLTEVFAQMAECMDENHEGHPTAYQHYCDLSTVVGFLESCPDLTVPLEGLHLVAAHIGMRSMMKRMERVLREQQPKP